MSREPILIFHQDCVNRSSRYFIGICGLKARSLKHEALGTKHEQLAPSAEREARSLKREARSYKHEYGITNQVIAYKPPSKSKKFEVSTSNLKP